MEKTSSTGIDAVRVERLQGLSGNRRFLERVFTESEVRYCLARREPHKHLAGRFAAKEAFIKAVSTGPNEGLSFRDIEVIKGPAGRPGLRLYDKAAEKLGGRRACLSISYAGAYALALVAIG